jgi:hypothetical protein
VHWSIREREATAFYNLDNMLWIRMTLSRTLVGTEGKEKARAGKKRKIFSACILGFAFF